MSSATGLAVMRGYSRLAKMADKVSSEKACV